MSKNRVGLTIRFNIEEQKQLAMICEFFGKSHKDIVKLALNQLFVATGQISKKLTEAPPPQEPQEEK